MAFHKRKKLWICLVKYRFTTGQRNNRHTYTTRETDRWRIQDFPEGGAPTPKSVIIFQFFAENCMKMKEFGPPGGRPWPPWIRHCRQRHRQTDKIHEISTVLYPRKRCHCRLFYLTCFDWFTICIFLSVLQKIVGRIGVPRYFTNEKDSE